MGRTLHRTWEIGCYLPHNLVSKPPGLLIWRFILLLTPTVKEFGSKKRATEPLQSPVMDPSTEGGLCWTKGGIEVESPLSTWTTNSQLLQEWIQ